MLDRLVSSGYIVIKGDRAELIRRFKTNKNHSQIYREAREIIINVYLSTQRPPNK
ncbi:hypothetical protein [Vulcanisaeta distributa]|uniref:hypothetical protein n=1 Tax=Vulcanisaeta distributa TaxID=164451 RepID=UPI001FB3DB69|nr:hypothetical protein [Vulcanisaeta distributa]